MFNKIPEEIIANHIFCELSPGDACALALTCKVGACLIAKYPLHINLNIYFESADKSLVPADKIACYVWFYKHIDKCNKILLATRPYLIEHLLPHSQEGAAMSIVLSQDKERSICILGKASEIIGAALINPLISARLSPYAKKYVDMLISNKIGKDNIISLVIAVICATDSLALIEEASKRWQYFRSSFIEYLSIIGWPVSDVHQAEATVHQAEATVHQAEATVHQAEATISNSFCNAILFMLHGATFQDKIKILCQAPGGPMQNTKLFDFVIDESFIDAFCEKFIFEQITVDEIKLLSGHLRKFPQKWANALVIEWQADIKRILWQMSHTEHTHILLLECLFIAEFPLSKDKLEEIAAKCNISLNDLYFDIMNISHNITDYWKTATSVLNGIDFANIIYEPILNIYNPNLINEQLFKLLPKVIKFNMDCKF